MNTMNNIQNKVCSLNIDMNGTIITNVPVLFRIHESGERTIDEIISDNIESILKIIYKNAKSIDDLLFSRVRGIIYDITTEQDEYDTYELWISNMLNFEDEISKELITNQINRYSTLLLDKINVEETANTFDKVFEIVNKHNEKKISPTTFIQYIMSCFNKEYDNITTKNKLTKQVEDIMNNILNK